MTCSPQSASAPSRPQEISPDVFELRAPLVSWESLVTSPTTDTLNIETDLGVMGENSASEAQCGESRETVLREKDTIIGKNNNNAWTEVKLEVNIGTDNGRREENIEIERKSNSIENYFCDQTCDPHEKGDREEISETESFKEEAEQSDNDMDVLDHNSSDSFVSVKAQISGDEVILGNSLSKESSLDLISLD